MANIDERLLAGDTLTADREPDAAGKLREDKRGSKTEPGEEEAAEQDGEPADLRQSMMAAKNIKERAKEKLEEKVLAPAKQGTNYLLRWAWLTLIPSWGLSLIYINMHVFLRMVLGEKLFCKLGEEWIPKQIAGVGGEEGKIVNKSIGIVEVMGLLLLDLMALFLILIIFTFLTMIVSFMGAGLWQKIKWIWTAIGSLGWSAISALVSLFK